MFCLTGLGVEPQQVVLGEAESADRGLRSYAAVRSMPVVTVEPSRQLCGAVIRGRIGPGIGPFPEGGLDEAFSLAIGPGRIGAGPEVLEPEPPAGLGKRLGAVAGAVVGHDAQDADAKARKVGQSGLQESDGALLPLVGQDLDESDARGVVEADVDELPAGAAAPGGTRAGDAVADLLEAAELLMSRWISSPGLARS